MRLGTRGSLFRTLGSRQSCLTTMESTFENGASTFGQRGLKTVCVWMCMCCVCMCACVCAIKTGCSVIVYKLDPRTVPGCWQIPLRNVDPYVVTKVLDSRGALSLPRTGPIICGHVDLRHRSKGAGRTCTKIVYRRNSGDQHQTWTHAHTHTLSRAETRVQIKRIVNGLWLRKITLNYCSLILMTGLHYIYGRHLYPVVMSCLIFSFLSFILSFFLFGIILLIIASNESWQQRAMEDRDQKCPLIAVSRITTLSLRYAKAHALYASFSIQCECL